MNSVMGAFETLGNEIKALKEQLVMKERLAALGEVSAGIAHEFRNPMGVIAGYAKILLKGFPAEDNRREVAQGILDEIEIMNHIMEELLKFSKTETIDKRDVDIKRSIDEIVLNLAENRDRITFDHNEPCIVKGDEILLKQAIRNLVLNALDAGEAVVITLGGGSQAAKNGVYVNVRDNGPGISGEAKSKIFMPFYTTKPEGTGIGLPFVQKVAVAHGGSVSVISDKGKGSTFRIFLPY